MIHRQSLLEEFGSKTLNAKYIYDCETFVKYD